MKIKPGYTFDDVLLVPKHSEIKSRQQVDTSVDLGKGVLLDVPIVSANMKTVTGPDMANRISKIGGLAILHRFQDTMQDRLDIVLKTTEMISNDPNWETLAQRIGISVGVSGPDRSFLALLRDHIDWRTFKVVCIDVAHGDSANVLKMIDYVKKDLPEKLLVAGNVATATGAQRLYDAGADVIKVGVGPGSLCTTRTETGNGVPQLTALEEVYEQGNRGTKFKIIADGGIKRAGDMVKALCFSHAVMLGNMLAGTNEAPGEIVKIDDKYYKTYQGSSTHKVNHVEGVSGLVPCKGPVDAVAASIMQGVRSGMSYQGSSNLTELRRYPEFVQVTHAGLIESHPHDIMVH